MRAVADTIYAACSNPNRLLAYPTPDGARRLATQLRATIRDARRFYVDEEVTLAATTLGVQHPDILLAMLKRARLPFGTCWVEWDNRAQVSAAGGVLAEDAPARVGVLAERLDPDLAVFRLTIIGLGDDDGRQKVAVSPCSVLYDLDQPMDDAAAAADRRLIAAASRLPEDYLRRTLVGGAYMEGPDPSRRDADEMAHRRGLCDALARHACHVLSPLMEPVMRPAASGDARYRHGEVERVLRNAVVEESGTWRMVVSLFALINARDCTDSEAPGRAGRSRSVGAKVVPYLEHRLVSLKLPRKLVVERLVRQYAEAIPRRRHEVAGHWKQSRIKGTPNCEHAYVDETPKRQVCAVPGCGHKRWFVNEFARGDARLGWVTKDYHVERAPGPAWREG